MKTSNKILVGAVLTIMLVLAAVHIALYAKYKKGDFVTRQQLHEERYVKQTLKGVTNIRLSGLANVDIMPSDTFVLEIENQGKDHEITVEQKGDSLILNGGNSFKDKEGKINLTRSYYSVILHLPSGASIITNESEVRIKGAKDTISAPLYSINGNNTEFTFGETRNGKPGGSYYKSIDLYNRNGRVLFFNDVMLGNLSLHLTNGSTEDQGMQAESIALEADDQSTVSLKGNNLKKIINK